MDEVPFFPWLPHIAPFSFQQIYLCHVCKSMLCQNIQILNILCLNKSTRVIILFFQSAGVRISKVTFHTVYSADQNFSNTIRM